MLREFSDLRQDTEGHRRLFSDETFDLYLWYDRVGGKIVGFQLCYDKGENEHALTWIEGKGYLHSRIDDGESSVRENLTPVLARDGFFDRHGVAERFREASREIERGIAELVYRRILAFEAGKVNPLL